jgi:hypothetical protein
MTDKDASNEQPAAVQDWSARANEYAARKQAIHTENRAAIFDALERSGIEAVTMTFDGYGDSGQIGEVCVTAGTEHDLAAIEIEQKRADWHTDAIETVTVALRTVIEDMGYELLERSYCGWMNNEGGFGQFVFDVPARRITLDFNQRYAGCESYAHEF